MPYTFQQRVLAVPAWLRAPLMLVALSGMALGIYWWCAYAGLYRWLIEWEIDKFGWYEPVYTGLFTVGLTFALSGGLVGLIFFVIVRLDVYPADDQTALDVEARTARSELWLREHKGRLIGLIVGVLVGIAGTVLVLIGSSRGSLRELDVADLEAGKAPPSLYVKAKGRLLADRAASQREGTFLTHYTPLVSDRWKEGNPVTVYVLVPEERKDEALRGQYSGTLLENGLPGPVHTRFEGGVTPPGRPYYLMHMGRKPETLTFMGVFLLSAAGAILLGTAVVWVVKGIRARNTRL